MPSMLPASAIRLTPVRESSGTVIDFLVQAIAPDVAAVIDRTVEEVVGGTLRDILPNDAATEFIAALTAALDDGSTHTAEYPILSTATVTPWFAESVTPETGGTLLVIIRVLVGTEPREQAAAAATRNDRYRAALHAAGLTVWEIDPVTGWMTASVSHRALFDLPPTTPLPRSVTELQVMVHPDDQSHIAEAIRATVPTLGEIPAPFEVEYRVLTPSSEVRWLLTMGGLWRPSAADPWRIHAITRDVSVRVTAQSQLEESEQRFRSSFDGSSIGMALLAPDGTTVRANAALAGILGYPHGEADTIHWTAILHPGEHADAAENLGKIARQELVATRIERRCVRQDGTVIWTKIAASGVHDSRGRLVNMIVQVEDISVDLAATAARKEIEERLAMVLTATREGVWDRDLVANTVYCGPRWWEILGHPANATLGGDDQFAEFVHPDDLERVLEAGEAHCQSETTEMFDETFRMRHRDGHWVWVRSRGRATDRDENGRARRMVGTHSDVSSNRAMEEQLRQSQKMDAIGKLAGGIAHDFNNLLTAIGATTALVLEDLSATNPHYEHVREISLAADRAKSLTRQLLNFSRLEVEQVADVEVDQIVERIAPLLRRLLGPAQTLSTTLQAPGEILRLDPANLELALLNLVANSRDAMPHGGTVTIETSCSEEPAHDGELHRSYLVLAVRDTGTGMTAEIRERIFEPFFTTKPQGEGTGLGLPTVYGFVRRHGGLAQVESAPGTGTVIRLLFPISRRVQGEYAARTITAETAIPKPVHRVLVVDDDDLVRRSTARLLEHRGIAVVQVSGAEQALLALDAAVAEPFDVVLSDHAMPGRTGHELLEEVRLRFPAQRVVLMSGFADDGKLRQTFGKQEIPFLAKPFTLQELLAALSG